MQELLKQTMITARSPVKISTLFFKKWTTVTLPILSVTKADILHQRKDGCN